MTTYRWVTNETQGWREIAGEGFNAKTDTAAIETARNQLLSDSGDPEKTVDDYIEMEFTNHPDDMPGIWTSVIGYEWADHCEAVIRIVTLREFLDGYGIGWREIVAKTCLREKTIEAMYYGMYESRPHDSTVMLIGRAIEELTGEKIPPDTVRTMINGAA